MVNYQNGMIYKLVCNNLDITDIYIGSTTNFKQRKRGHKKVCNNPNNKRYNLKVYKFIRDNGGFENWSMILVATTPCNSKLELTKHERHYYEKLNATLNMRFPQRTQKEYNKTNKDIIKIKKKEWAENNKEYVKIKAKKYREDNKEIIKIKKKEYHEANKEYMKIKKKEYQEANKEILKIKKKEYYKANKEILKIKQNKYRESNKEIIKIKKALKINCSICDKFITKDNIKRHQKTKTCIEIGKLI